ncbi:MAG: DUF47 family protein [Bacteroidetes bacterium]|jgi:uncharacterized protein|nr:DUF47 family protein [Bacteroidota bacterium]MBT5529959.1 DUF47 family protein [Cytophagia bacterium]MBT3422148.1 DUF47 family protein [Bacteroidota bacterium]MBT3800629.1 DUF47 family protein [Bacteroidota bacterium]MBT3932658.1 DUF47 family protein [Bacteroidota bacterium]
MSKLFKTAGKVIHHVDEFINAIEEGVMLFNEAINNYLDDDKDRFKENLKRLDKIEARADSIQRKIENYFFIHSLIPQHSADVILLIDKLDDIIDTAKTDVGEFEVEVPEIPAALVKDYSRLTEISTAAANAAISAARLFFTEPMRIKDYIHKIYLYEREADKFANDIKLKLFQELDELELAQKIHLRYFALHIEQVSDCAEEVADILSQLSIKVMM